MTGEADIVVDVRDQIGKINRHIYGHFIEHLGRCIYGGVWVGEGSRIPNLHGLRKDVLEVVKEIRPPIIRWPGGNFASGYHWEDGIGPRERRPVKYDLAWEAEEPNQFGTDEFIAFCREVGAEPYICVNAGSGTPEEAAHWVEYCNRRGNSLYASKRVENGHPEPFNVKYWGIGNEMYGAWQIGHMNAADYAKSTVEFAKLMRRVDPTIRLVAVGCDQDDWNYEVLKTAGEHVDYISLHKYYGYEEDYYAVVASPLEAERSLKHLSGLINAVMATKKRRVEIAFDEWNVWRREANRETGYTQKSTLQDGIFAAGVFHVLHRLCQSVTMANLAQLVNVLPAIVTNEKGLYVNPIYLAFKLYVNHSGDTAIRTRTEAETYRAEKIGVESVPYLDCSATLHKEGGTLYLAAINRHKDEAIKGKIELQAFKPERKGRVYELNAEEVSSANDFDSPDKVKIVEKAINDVSNQFGYTFPAHSVTVLELFSV
ncbi:MAG: alpha-L-arabinofuranosidase C-terminal domain-containing protein [Candidatus Bathyarchaeia archaeon]